MWGLVSQETAMLCWSWSEAWNFGTHQVDKGQISALKDNEADISNLETSVSIFFLQWKFDSYIQVVGDLINVKMNSTYYSLVLNFFSLQTFGFGGKGNSKSNKVEIIL